MITSRKVGGDQILEFWIGLDWIGLDWILSVSMTLTPILWTVLPGCRRFGFGLVASHSWLGYPWPCAKTIASLLQGNRRPHVVSW